jgi:RNA polymerase sigma factor (sigma-70 family)
MRHTLPPDVARLLDAADSRSQDTAWAGFLASYSRLLLHTARSLGGDYDAAMDRYAYVVERLRADDCHRLRGYAADGRGKFTTWLVVVARRLCLDHHRQRYGRPRSTAAVQEAEHRSRRRLVDLVGDEVELSQLRDEAGGDPERDLCAAELRQALEVGLQALEPRDRLLLRLRYEDGLPAAEIARLMDLPTPFHVYRRLNHLLEGLRRSLAREGLVDPIP